MKEQAEGKTHAEENIKKKKKRRKEKESVNTKEHLTFNCILLEGLESTSHLSLWQIECG